MLKRFVKSAFAAWLASVLIAAYIRLTHATSHWTFIGKEDFESAAAQGKGVILAFWHGRLLMAPTVRSETDARVFMLISAHRDGEIIANGVKSFGIEFIRGSAANPKNLKKQGRRPAIILMADALKSGNVVGVTPDGPRGPGEKLNKGIIRLAQMTGAPIVPAAYSTSRGKKLSTWDRFLVAAPFSKGVYVAGKPIFAPKEKNPEAVESARQSVENALLDVTRRADAFVGRTDDANGNA